MQQATSKLQEAIDLIKTVDNTSAITRAYTAAINNATNAITGNSGGYVVLNPVLNPQELLVMNTSDKTTATKLWRWNLGGLGYSKNGYNGPFTTAITMDGQIVADFITTGTLTANIIKAGILSSADGNSYFNLESGLIHTANAEIVGGSISIGGGTYKTVIEDGSIKQHLTSGTTPLGGMIPIISGSDYYECVYVSNLSSSKGVSLAYQNSDGSFTAIGEFLKNGVNIFKTTKFSNSIYTNEAAGNVFTAVAHYRTTNFGGDNTSAYTAIAAFGCGIAHSKPSVGLQLQNYGYSTITGRLDIFPSEGEAMICLRGMRESEYSNELELGKHIWFKGEINAKKFNASSTEEIKENIRPVSGAASILQNTSVYQYNLVPESTTVEPDGADPETDFTLDGSEFIVFDGEDTPITTQPEAPAVTKDSVGFVISEDTPDILLSDDKKHIDLYTVVSLNWKVTQEILQRLETLEGSST